MHCVNLGLAWLLIGNALYYLADAKAFLYLGPAYFTPLDPGASMDDILLDLQYRFKRYLREHRLTAKVPRFTKSALHLGGAIFYRCKAGQSPRLVAWMARITLEFAAACPAAARPQAQVLYII